MTTHVHSIRHEDGRGTTLWHTHRHDVRHPVDVSRSGGHLPDDPRWQTLRTYDKRTADEVVRERV